jgi:hypothetical protein
MPVSTITIAGEKTGLPSGTKVIGPLVTTNPTSVGFTQDLTTVNGNNTINVPGGAIGFILIPPAGNTTAIVLKGVSGDTGVTLHPTDPSKISLAASQATFVLNVAGIITLEIEWY